MTIPAPRPTDRFLLLRSIPLRRLSSDGTPEGIASGCIVDYCGARWLLAVSHAVGPDQNWAIECRYDPGRGTQVYRLGQMSYAALAALGAPTLQNLDLAYVRVPCDLRPRWQPCDAAGNRTEDLPRELSILGDVRPAVQGEYGFAGNVCPKHEFHHGLHYFSVEQVAHSGLRYVEDRGHLNVFRLAHARPSDESLKGTSGAPILDASGNVVALVCGAGAEPDCIEGVPASYFRSLIAAASVHLPDLNQPLGG